MKNEQVVKITGAGHGCNFTSLKRAEQHVENGKAEWVIYGKTIAFKDNQEFVANQFPTHTDGKISGSFQWHVGESAGFQVMQAEHGA